MVTPAQRWAVVTDAQTGRGLPLARACLYLGIHRALVRYVVRCVAPPALCVRLRDLAVATPRWGSPRLTWRLRREGWRVNHKRIERLVRIDRLRWGTRRNSGLIAGGRRFASGIRLAISPRCSEAIAPCRRS